MTIEHDSRNSEKLGILSRILTFFQSLFHITTSENDEKYLMKRIAAHLKQNEKYFQISTQMVTPAFAETVYAIYKVLSPAQKRLDRFRKPGLLATHIIAELLPAEIVTIVEELHPDTIIEKRNQGFSSDEISGEVKQNIAKFLLAFEALDTKNIYVYYNASQAFLDFCRFPYEYFLKNFDPVFKEDDPSYKPSFNLADSKPLINDLIDFVDGLYALIENVDWGWLFEILGNGSSKNIISITAWEKVLNFRKKMLEAKTLQYIVQYVINDPDWKTSPYRNNNNIVREYILKITHNAELTVRVINAEEDKKQIAKLLDKIFGDKQIVRNKNYSELFSDPQVRKIYKMQIFIQPLDLIKTFYQIIFKVEIENVVESLINYGKWVADYYQKKITDSFYGVIETSKQIILFDDDLSSEGVEGIKIRSLIKKVQDDPYALQEMVIKNLQMINAKAEDLIKMAIRLLEDLSDSISYLISEKESNDPTIILNLEEIFAGSQQPIAKTLDDIQHKINRFIELIDLSMGFATNSGSHEMKGDILSPNSIPS